MSVEVNRNVPLEITADQLRSRVFEYGSFDPASGKKRALTRLLGLAANGRIRLHDHRSFAKWRVEDGKLLILDEAGEPSFIFGSAERTPYGISLQGRSVKAGGPVASLTEKVSGSPRLQALPKLLSFNGEFGEELNHFIPYVHWLHRTGAMLDRRVATYAGMRPFYFFLDDDQLVLRDNKPRRFIRPDRTNPHYLHASGLRADEAGMEWAPDYRGHFRTDFGFSKPILAVHNKYTAEWGGGPVNYFPEAMLRHIFESLGNRYQIIFFGAARPGMASRGYSFDHQVIDPQDDWAIAGRYSQVINFETLLAQSQDDYNTLKLKVYASCHHFITVQGGNAHMCALFPGSLIAIQHIRGREETHAYHAGTFQYLANPRPLYLIGRDDVAMRDLLPAFEDSLFVGDRVHLGPRGVSLYQRYNPAAWRQSPA